MADTNGDPVDDEEDKTTEDEETEETTDDESTEGEDDEGGSSSGGSSTGKTPDYTNQLKKLNDINDNLKKYLKNIEDALNKDSSSGLEEQIKLIADALQLIDEKILTDKEPELDPDLPTSDEISKYLGERVNFTTKQFAGITINMPRLPSESQKLKKLDLDQDGQITQKDLDELNKKIEEATPKSINNSLLLIPDRIKDALKGNTYLNDKEMYFKECILQLYANTNFEYTSKSNRVILKDCIDRAKLLTEEVFNNKV